MTTIYRDIFRAIHEGKWLAIEYRNQSDQITKYWIGIHDFNVAKRTLSVEGLHLGKYSTQTFDRIFIDSIQSSKIIEGSYCPVNKSLVDDIYLNPHKYKIFFDNIANLKILNYLEMCNRMDNVPYYSDFELIHYLDRDSFNGRNYPLSDEQFKAIVKNFQYKAENDNRLNGKLVMQQLGMNVLSIHTRRGLYVLAYRKLQLDVKKRVLRPDDEITICVEYTIDGVKESARKFLDADDFELLKDFEENQEKIKDCITKSNASVSVDDMPYIIGLGMDVVLDLHSEYQAILDMYEEDKVTVPIKAFFGDLLNRPIRHKAYPITLIDKKVNLDQLLAINNGMKYPVTYIQGPPGTGKTNTIINTILTAFFNGKTVLFCSYNNHPINGVFDKLCNITYRKKTIPFPVLRLGNRDKEKESLQYMKRLYEAHKDATIFEGTLDKNRDYRIERTKKLSALLKQYEDVLDLHERDATLTRLLEYEKKNMSNPVMIPFQADLQERQLSQIQQKIQKAGVITDEQALSLLDDNVEDFKKYLYYTSEKYIKKIGLPQNEELYNIIYEEDEDTQLQAFKKYLSKKDNIKKLQKIFPVIITTCISAHKLGEPNPMFDMVIMDEASQCNTAVSLVPIIRGENLMLVGDPQQLNPVILLDEMVNQKLRRKYNVTDEYDYRKNSIYKTFLACDSVSDEILLHHHYRCNKKIIDFNNKKYYNSKLSIASQSAEEKPLVYVDVPNARTDTKNTAPAEVAEIVKYAAMNKDKSIGVITPFVNQKKLIENALKEEGLEGVSCGTIHAFQGDEKDVVLFSTAITGQTGQGTYEWLKNNKELINVATSRAKDKLILLSDMQNLNRLHREDSEDDLYELVQYVRANGESKITPKTSNSRALGIKPYSTVTEEAFLKNLNHALENIWMSQSKYTIEKEVAISQVFQDNPSYSDLFYTGRFDFVVYERQGNSL
ncbi:MAG: DEAD/DEAH box helicase, partial [Lachnospiraceae bacterium]